MPPKFNRLLLAAVVLTSLVGSAYGGPLLTDAAAMVTGADVFSKTVSIFTLKARVEYAVYAPGQFSASSVLGNPIDPTGGEEYVYAYEIFNDLGGNRTVSNLSIGLNDNVLSESSTAWAMTTAEGGSSPSTWSFIPLEAPMAEKANVKWEYNSGALALGSHSNFLLFTSPYEPSYMNAAMTGGAVAASGTLPSPLEPPPVPEPSTLVLAALAAAGLLATGFARRHRV